MSCNILGQKISRHLITSLTHLVTAVYGSDIFRCAQSIGGELRCSQGFASRLGLRQNGERRRTFGTLPVTVDAELIGKTRAAEIVPTRKRLEARMSVAANDTLTTTEKKCRHVIDRWHRAVAYY